MMVRICPKPCGRLATAAILIIIGVIQLMVGVILLKSEYANLLSGPDFMTASSNIAVGSVYGITASIWKVSIKRKSTKNTSRTNVLAALLLSVITINTTTLIVLISGEGHKLLTLHLENNRLGIVDFSDEILAYAFVASVCSPITCIVVALVSFSGRCLEMYRDKKAAKQGNKIKNEDRYKWAFEVKERADSSSKTPSSVSESLSTSDDSVFSEKEDSYPRRKSALSVDSIPSPLDMWTQTREKMLSEDILSPQQSLFTLQSPNFRISPYEKIIPRIKESSLVKHPPSDLTNTISLCYRSTNPPNICRSILKRSSSNPAPGEEVFLRDSVDKQFCVRNKISEERAANVHSKMPAINDNKGDINCQINRTSDHLRARTLVSSNGRVIGNHVRSGQTLNPIEESEKEIINFEDPVISELKAETLKELQQKVQDIDPTASAAKLPNNSKGIKEASGPGYPVGVPVEDVGSRKYSHNSNGFQYESNSGLDGNKILSRRSLPTNELSTSNALPTKTPTSSRHPVIAYRSKTMNADSSAIGRLRSKSVDFSHDSRTKKFNLPEVVKWVMTTEGKKMEKHLGSPKAVSLKQNRKPDSSRKMSMASIAEIPSEDISSSLHDTAFIAPQSRRKSHIFDENSNIEVRMSPSSRRISSVRTAQRKSSVSSNSLLKRMWSTAASTEPKMNVADLIVDEDSLIGLSDEELLARTYRIRSLRKSVEHRLKQKAEVGK